VREWLGGIVCFLGVMGIFWWLIFSGLWLSKTDTPQGTVYAWSFWTWLGPILLAVGCAVLGTVLSLHERFETAAGCLLIMGLFPCVSGLVFGCIGLVVPDRYNVLVDGEHFETRVGETPVTVCYDDVSEIHVAESWSLGFRRGIPYPSHSAHLVVVHKAGP